MAAGPDGPGGGNRHRALDPAILRPAAVEHRQLAGGQQHALAVRTIDVLLEKQVRRQPLRLRREHVTLPVLELKPARRRRAVVVQHLEWHRDRRLHGEQHRDFRAKPEVLRSLPHVEGDCGLAAPGLARIHQRHRVLGFEPAEVRRHRRRGEQLQLEKAIRAPFGVLVFTQVLLLHPVAGELRHARVYGSRLRAPDAEPLRATAFVDDLHEHRRIAGLLQHRRCRSPFHSHARFRIDVHGEQHSRIEQFLQPLRIAGLTGSRQIGTEIGGPRRPEILQRLSHALDVCRKRLCLDRDGRERSCAGQRLRPARGERVFERRSAISQICPLGARRSGLRRTGEKSDGDGQDEGGIRANLHPGTPRWKAVTNQQPRIITTAGSHRAPTWRGISRCPRRCCASRSSACPGSRRRPFPLSRCAAVRRWRACVPPSLARFPPP